MFVNNNDKKEIKLRSFEGYAFTIPTGVSWIWDLAGEHLLANVYKVESSGKDKFGFDNGHGVPGLFASTEKEWVKQGKQLTQVTRFRIDSKLVPRVNLVKIARKRGIDRDRCAEYTSDPDIDSSTIAEEINVLPISDEVRYPKSLETKEELATA